MTPTENIYNHNGTEVKYLFSKAKQDRQHLLVVFSGFMGTYDFSGKSAEGCRSNILWIKDEFEKNYSYYICKENDFTIEHAVIELISYWLSKLSLTKNDCTLLGFSKGGSAALYFGLKYDIKNIISSCPQLKIGTYISKEWGKTAKHIMGEDYTSKHITNLDKCLLDLLTPERVSDKNIYLISSPNDEQFAEQIEPFLYRFIPCKNFNFVFTKSPLAWQHNKVTRYNLPIIISIIYAHGEGVHPSFGYIENGENKYSNNNSLELNNKEITDNYIISELISITLSDGVIKPSGVGIIHGIECSNYNSIEQTLVLEGMLNKYEFDLGKVLDPELSYKYFSDKFVNYSAGHFKSIGNNGIDISELPCDVYTVKCRVKSKNIVQEAVIKCLVNIDIQDTYNEKLISINKYYDTLKISIDSLRENYQSRIFEVKNKYLINSQLHYEGVFVVRGVVQQNWNDAWYYLFLKSEKSTHTFKLGRCDHKDLDNIFHNHCNVYRKSYFCTIARKGIDISDIPNGTYEIQIVLNKSGSIFKETINDKLLVDNMQYSLLSS